MSASNVPSPSHPHLKPEVVMSAVNYRTCLEVNFVENSKRLKENAQSIVAHYEIWHLPRIIMDIICTSFTILIYAHGVDHWRPTVK